MSWIGGGSDMSWIGERPNMSWIGERPDMSWIGGGSDMSSCQRARNIDCWERPTWFLGGLDYAMS